MKPIKVVAGNVTIGVSGKIKGCVYSHIRPALAFVSARKDGPNAQMSGLGGEAEFLCSTRALPVLTLVV